MSETNDKAAMQACEAMQARVIRAESMIEALISAVMVLSSDDKKGLDSMQALLTEKQKASLQAILDRVERIDPALAARLDQMIRQDRF